MGARHAEMAHLGFCDLGVDSRHRSRQGCRKVPVNQKAFGRPSWSGLGQIWGPDTRKWLTCGSVIRRFLHVSTNKSKLQGNNQGRGKGPGKGSSNGPGKGSARVPAYPQSGLRQSPVDGVNHSPSKRPKAKVPVEFFFEHAHIYIYILYKYYIIHQLYINNILII